MSWYLPLPLVIPFATAIIAYLLRNSPTGRWVSVIGSAAAFVAAIALMRVVLGQGVLAGQMGQWAAPFGITLVADLLSAVMVLITAITGLAVAIYAIGDVNERHERLGYHALFQILLAGVTGAFLTGDLFNLYVWFEVMLIASFGLLILNGDKEANTISGGEGRDTIGGLGGDDMLFGGDKKDNIGGGDGNDMIDGGKGNDTIFGGDTRDTITGGVGEDILFGQKGADTITGGKDNDQIRDDKMEVSLAEFLDGLSDQ